MLACLRLEIQQVSRCVYLHSQVQIKCRVMTGMARPERFELPTSWFVASFSRTTKVYYSQRVSRNELCY